MRPKLNNKPSNGFTARKVTRRPAATRLLLERLEDRCTPATVTVNSTADVVAANDGSVTLREAVMAINNLGTNDNDILNQLNNQNPPTTFGKNDTVKFAIAGAGPHTIFLDTAVTIARPVYINGYSQANSKPNTDPGFSNADIRVIVRANNAVKNQIDGLVFDSETNGSRVDGLSIGDFQNGILLNNASGLTADGIWVGGCYVGILPDGKTAIKNLKGISIWGGGNCIGGYRPDDRNVISGNFSYGVEVLGLNASNNVVAGNLIGTDASGKSALAAPLQRNGISLEPVIDLSAVER